MKKILKAIKFARKAYEGKQKKSTERPLFSHPVRVGMTLLDEGFPRHVVIAGLLHDVAEESDYTLDDIEKRFGAKARGICEPLTEDKNEEWMTRKAKALNRLKEGGDYVQAVSCCDKIDTISTALSDYNEIGDRIWDRFEEGKDKQIWFYESAAAILCTEENLAKKTRIFRKLKHLVEELEKIK